MLQQHYNIDFFQIFDKRFEIFENFTRQNIIKKITFECFETC